jgi:DNA polymerase-1
MRSAYLVPLLEKRGSDGRIHSAFSSARTVTGRLASSEPNLQTIPKESTNALVRSLFVPEPGVELWEFDLSQAELRVAAGFSQDERLIHALENDIDLHSQVAAAIWHDDDFDGFLELLEAGDVTAQKQRGIGKNINYSFQYGVGPAKLAIYLVAGTGLPVTPAVVNEAATILAGYRSTYPGLTRLMNGMTRMADEHGYIPLHVPGRYRRYRGPRYRDTKTYTALNAIVQGGIGEFMKDVHLSIHGPISAYGRICLQVHDSFVMELDPGSGPVVASLLQETADAINPFRMRMLWDAKAWGHGNV